MVDSARLSPTLEDYLEAISRVISKSKVARVRDVAAAMGVHKSTVTAALKSLSEKGLVEYSPYEVTTLTASGREAASEVLQRHELIREFLTDVLLIDEDVADANACRMEHAMEPQVLERLAVFAELAKENRRSGTDILESLERHVKQGTEVQESRPTRQRRKANSTEALWAENKGE